ncbi:maleylpyruvate isomerase family mycothiol-dependent enzyme [Jiangella alba]|uniref:Maleylpyruvate isomerase n=1 Tax=Jiangella alba TaxID=561176 RepID=A0A1H5Q0E6_9ACTN|nr:maleylpyruvate isomerase family mycothiol-dependent enzyme [Jiangella alba]SEF18717.1 maleylpyruvate isomerase [Jiangella alba]
MAARTDRTEDPALAAALLLARRGQAYFSRFVRDLRDDELDAPSLVPGWSRRHIVAHVGLNARALTRLTTWAASGVETPMYSSPAARVQEIDLAATLPATALRNLSDHAAIHLNVEWRDLDDESWLSEVVTAQGRRVPARETVWMRTREVWVHAVDLDAGGRFEDLPARLLDQLLADVRAAWGRRPAPLPTMTVTDRDPGDDRDPQPASEAGVIGTAAAVTRWATGRGAAGVSALDGGPVPAAPAWL